MVKYNIEITDKNIKENIDILENLCSNRKKSEINFLKIYQEGLFYIEAHTPAQELTVHSVQQICVRTPGERWVLG